MATLHDMTLAERVRYFRKLRELTQVQLAQMADTNLQQITSIEAGETSNPRNLENIAKALGVPVSMLKYGVIALDEAHTVSIGLAAKIEKLDDDSRLMVERLVDKLLSK